MASYEHQFILGLIIKKMRIDGVKIKYAEGKFLSDSNEIQNIPPNILRHRPDVLGININNQVCIGDAKTASDIGSRRTKEQLIDYTSIELNCMKCVVYIGIPKSVDGKLKRVLQDLGIVLHPEINIISIPDEIINTKSKEGCD